VIPWEGYCGNGALGAAWCKKARGSIVLQEDRFLRSQTNQSPCHFPIQHIFLDLKIHPKAPETVGASGVRGQAQIILGKLFWAGCFGKYYFMSFSGLFKGGCNEAILMK
jgi:hypothetical protein